MANRGNSISGQFSRLADEVADGLERVARNVRGGAEGTGYHSAEGRNRVDRFMSDPFSIARPMFGRDYPRIEVRDKDDAFVVKAEMPGLGKDDFSLEVSDDHILIRGERRGECEDRSENYLYRECSYGSFSRTVNLSCRVKPDEADAEYKDGILTVTLPKVEDSRPKKVSVKVT